MATVATKTAAREIARKFIDATRDRSAREEVNKFYYSLGKDAGQDDCATFQSLIEKLVPGTQVPDLAEVAEAIRVELGPEIYGLKHLSEICNKPGIRTWAYRVPTAV